MLFEFDALEVEERKANCALVAREEDALGPGSGALGKAGHLLWQGSADAARAVSFFGPGIVALPLLGQVVGLEESRCLSYAAFPASLEEGGVWSRAELEVRFGRPDPATLLQELARNRAESEQRLRALGDADLREEVAVLRAWKVVASTRLRALEQRTAWAFLGLFPGSASRAEIKRAFKRRALELHPDKGGDAGRFRALQEMTGMLLEQVLDCSGKEDGGCRPRKARRRPEAPDSGTETDEDPSASFPSAPAARRGGEDDDANLGDLGGTGDASFNRVAYEAARRRLHRDAAELWSQTCCVGEELRRLQSSDAGSCGNAAGALHQLRDFVRAFAATEVVGLQKAPDPTVVQRTFSRFLEGGCEALCAASSVDPLAAVASVSLEVGQPLMAATTSPALHHRCSRLLRALEAVPASLARHAPTSTEAAAARGELEDGDAAGSASAADAPASGDEAASGPVGQWQAVLEETEQDSDVLGGVPAADAPVSSDALPSVLDGQGRADFEDSRQEAPAKQSFATVEFAGRVQARRNEAREPASQAGFPSSQEDKDTTQVGSPPSQKERAAAALLSAAEDFVNQERWAEAAQTATEAHAHFRVLGNSLLAADALLIIVRATVRLHETRKAAATIAKEELMRCRAVGDRRGEATMLLALAEVNTDRRGPENRERAVLQAVEARDIFKEVGDGGMEGNALNTLAVVHLKRADKAKTPDSSISHSEASQRALIAAREAETLARKLGDVRVRAKALHLKAQALCEVERLKDAIAAGREALALYRELGLRRLEAFQLHMLAKWLLRSQDAQEALATAEESLAIYRSLGNRKAWETSTQALIDRARRQLQVEHAADAPALARAHAPAVAPPEAGDVFEVAFDRVFVRSAPDIRAGPLGVLTRGEQIQVCPARHLDSEGREWVMLTPFQFRLSCTSKGNQEKGFVLTDGSTLGIGPLLRKLAGRGAQGQR